MKMAKASKADLDMALELSSALDALTGRWGATMPEAIERPEGTSSVEYFDPEDREQCYRVVEYLRELVNRASLMRVVFGMAVVCDPRNEVVDPNANTLEVHPKFAALAADAARLRWMLAGNGYFLEEEMLCGHRGCSQEEQDEARRKIDAAMASETQNVC